MGKRSWKSWKSAASCQNVSSGSLLSKGAVVRMLRAEWRMNAVGRRRPAFLGSSCPASLSCWSACLGFRSHVHGHSVLLSELTMPRILRKHWGPSSFCRILPVASLVTQRASKQAWCLEPALQGRWSSPFPELASWSVQPRQQSWLM